MKRAIFSSRFLPVLFFIGFLLVLIRTDRLHATKPNVILVMADDLGIGDISPTNRECKIKTPHLQKMANEGLTFLDAHTPSSVCTPTRYGLPTGRYNWRSRLARGVLDVDGLVCKSNSCVDPAWRSLPPQPRTLLSPVNRIGLSSSKRLPGMRGPSGC